MGKIRMRSTSISDNPSLQSPVFHFSPYIADGNHTYYNNEDVIDFVTDGNSLYVCLSHNGVTPTYENVEDNGDFLKIVSQGPQGIRGPRGHDGDSAETPRLNAEFDNDQLRVYVNGELETVSPRLTGKAWRPKLEDNMIVWELSNKMYSPEPIDLEELRPTQEKPLLLRVDSDNTKRSDETSGPAGFIQWKYEGDQHWTNLISISELMNLTLAGVSIWKNDEGKWHFGHRKVIGATYESDKVGNRIISKVQLGDVLFDAGELPFEENSETRPDYSIDIDLIYTRLATIEEAMVKSVNGVPPGPDGDVKLNIPTLPSLDNYAQKDWVNSNFQPKGSYLTEQSLDGLVRRVRVNGTTHSPVDGTVDLGNIGGSSGTPTDTSDCVKSISINGGEAHTPVNGHVNLIIDTGTIASFDVRLKNDGKTLQKNSGNGWVDIVDLSQFGGSDSGSGCEKCWTEEEILALIGGTSSGLTEAEVKSLIGRILEGVLDEAIPEYVKTAGHNYFIRIDDLAGYATQLYVNNKINEAISQIGDGNITVETFRPFSLYTRTATSAAPAKPGTTAWKWYPNIDNMLHDASKQNPTAQDDDVVAGWSNNIPNATSQLPYLWQAWNVFSSVDGTNQGVEWDGPCPMFGEDGQDGKDGDNRKQIYKLCETYDYFIENRNSLKPSGVGPNVPSNWTAVEAGISEEYKLEIYCYSEYDGDTKQWSAWQGPYIWSMWGENGADGSGIEYIFFQQDSGTIASGNNPHNLSAEFIASNTYQTPDFQPNSTNTSGVVSGTWTDEPSGVDSDHKFEFACIRKYDGETKKWGAFSEPKIWSHYGRDAVDLTNDYLIVPTFNDVTKTPEGNGYIPMGTLKFEVYKNGVKQSGQYYGSSNTSTVAAYLGGLDGGQFLDGVLSDRVYTIDIHKNNKNMSVTWEDEPFIQILWYENNKQGKILDSAIVPVIIPGQNGSSQSLDGTVLRVSNYDSNGHYLNGEVATNGIYYLDVVKYNGDYYKCLTSNTSAAPTDNSGNVNAGWELFAIRSDSAFNTLLAQSAYIQDLTAKQVVITDNNAVVAGMTSSAVTNTALDGYTTGNVRIWAGPLKTSGNLTTAPFTVTDQGVAKFGDSENSIQITPKTMISGIASDFTTSSSDITISSTFGSEVKLGIERDYVQSHDITNDSAFLILDSAHNYNGGAVSHNYIKIGTGITSANQTTVPNMDIILEDGRGLFGSDVVCSLLNTNQVITKIKCAVINTNDPYTTGFFDDSTTTFRYEGSFTGCTLINKQENLSFVFTSSTNSFVDGDHFDLITTKNMTFTCGDSSKRINVCDNGTWTENAISKTVNPGKYSCVCYNDTWYITS